MDDLSNYRKYENGYDTLGFDKEDIPSYMKKEIEQYGKNRNFQKYDQNSGTKIN